MKPAIDFWFDFISPFGYLASLQIDDLAARHGRKVEWRPLLVGVTVLKVMGLPPVPETPLKGAYANRQLARHARRHGVTLGRNPAAPPMNPLPAGRLFAWLRVHAPEYAKGVARGIFDAYWVHGKAMDDPAELKIVAMQAGVSPAVVAAGLADPAAAGLLRAEVDAAIAAGAFGSPFFIVDSEPFFGFDNLGAIDDWLACGGC